MATETLSYQLSADNTKVKGKDIISGNENDTQIVTFLDEDDPAKDLPAEITLEKFGKGSPTESGQGPGGDDQFYIDLSGFDDNFKILVKSMDAGDAFHITGWTSWTTTGTLHTFTYTGSDGGTYEFKLEAQSLNGTDGVDVVQVVCFGRGTRIATETGEIAVEQLAAGDRVLCGDGIAREIAWVGSRAVDRAALKRHPNWRPFRVRENAFGAGRPQRALTLSPNHAVLLRDWRAELLFGEHEVLVPIKHLANDHSVLRDRSGDPVEYFHILLDGHHTVIADGLECETLDPASLTTGAFDADTRSEILGLFPDLATDLGSFGPTCRMRLRAYEIRALGLRPAGAAAI